MNRPFVITWKPANMVGSILFLLCSLLNALFMLNFAAHLVITLAAPLFLHFNLEKYQSYFSFSLLKTVDLFTSYFEVLKRQIHTLYFACLLTVSKNAIVTFP